MTASWRMDWKTSFPSAAAVRYMRDFKVKCVQRTALAKIVRVQNVEDDMLRGSEVSEDGDEEPRAREL